MTTETEIKILDKLYDLMELMEETNWTDFYLCQFDWDGWTDDRDVVDNFIKDFENGVWGGEALKSALFDFNCLYKHILKHTSQKIQ